MLAEDGIEAKVINIHTIKPIDSDLLVEAAKETGKVVTVEEHSVIGGLGGAVCEVLSEKYPVPVKRIGVNDVYGESGPAVKLIEKYGLDGKGLYASVKEFVKWSILFIFVCFPLKNQIVITYPFCQIKKVAEFLPFFAAILYILYGRNFTPMFNK